MKKNFYLLFLLLGFVFLTQAQSTDFGLLLHGSATINAKEKWYFSLKEELRFYALDGKLDRIASKFNADYLFAQKRLKVGVGIYFMNYVTDEHKITNRYRLNLNVTYREEMQRVGIDLRIRCQNSFFNIDSKEKTMIETYFRGRVKVDYKLQSTPVILFASSELFVDFNQKKHKGIHSIRSELGMEYKVKNKHKLIFNLRAENHLLNLYSIDIYSLCMGYAFSQ